VGGRGTRAEHGQYGRDGKGQLPAGHLGSFLEVGGRRE
jgi:hypothetical protein